MLLTPIFRSINFLLHCNCKICKIFTTVKVIALHFHPTILLQSLSLKWKIEEHDYVMRKEIFRVGIPDTQIPETTRTVVFSRSFCWKESPGNLFPSFFLLLLLLRDWECRPGLTPRRDPNVSSLIVARVHCIRESSRDESSEWSRAPAGGWANEQNQQMTSQSPWCLDQVNISLTLSRRCHAEPRDTWLVTWGPRRDSDVWVALTCVGRQWTQHHP